MDDEREGSIQRHRPVRRRISSPPPRAALSAGPGREYRLARRDADDDAPIRFSDLPSPGKEQMKHENRVYQETVEQVQRQAISYAERRNEQFREAAQRYAEHARQICQYEVNQTEQMAQTQMTFSIGMLEVIAQQDAAQSRQQLVAEANAALDTQKAQIVEEAKQFL